MSTYQKFAGVCGIVAGIAGLVYLISFFILGNPAALLPAIALLLAGFFTTAALVGVYQRVREANEGFALWGLILGLAGALGAAIHSAFDLSNALHPPATPFDYASPIDPRGFLTFAIAGLALIVLAWLIIQAGTLPRALGYLGIVTGILLVLLYFTYLILLNATNPVVLILIITTGLAQPIWYLWLGWVLWRSTVAAPVKIVPAPGG
jgi:hypothetical protein